MSTEAILFFLSFIKYYNDVSEKINNAFDVCMYTKGPPGVLSKVSSS